MESVGLQLLLQAVLIFINAFFAATELAVVSLNATRLKKMEEDGDKIAPKLLRLMEEPSGFLSTIQVGITLAGYLGSALAAENFSGYLVGWLYDDLGFRMLDKGALNMAAIVIITFILAYFTLILGELVPKRIAMQKPLEVARFAYRTVSVLAKIMRPVIWFLSFSTNVVLRLLHMKTQAEEDNVTEDEIRMMVDLGEEKGNIDENEKEWIQNIFDFDDISARHVMTPRTEVVAIPITADRETVCRTIRESGLSRYPVFEGDMDNIIGILYARDFLLHMEDKASIDMKTLLRPAYFVPETIHADMLFTNLQKKKVHIAIVLDEYGSVQGVVTLEDLMEEIVGNIYDEFDPEEAPDILQMEENLWQVSGTVTIDELSEKLDIDLEDETDYDTVGGMIINLLKAIPEDGSHVDVDGYGLHFRVEDIKERRITKAFISKEKTCEAQTAV